MNNRGDLLPWKVVVYRRHGRGQLLTRSFQRGFRGIPEVLRIIPVSLTAAYRTSPSCFNPPPRPTNTVFFLPPPATSNILPPSPKPVAEHAFQPLPHSFTYTPPAISFYHHVISQIPFYDIVFVLCVVCFLFVLQHVMGDFFSHKIVANTPPPNSSSPTRLPSSFPTPPFRLHSSLPVIYHSPRNSPLILRVRVSIR